ncbi:alpha/beta hydrolase [Plantactinospora sonchi]|uniref:Alpha/beta hydrolase n=1 Tax=Plantactinospora sonchi TaxID=1544735 RepID=A0ABU7S512_9ACTN
MTPPGPRPLLVLLHSPAVGPATWRPVAAELRARGREVRVPSLLDVATGDPPYWPRVVTAVRTALAGTPPRHPVALVGHSNAGIFLPTVRAALRHPVTASVFVDAALPARSGPTPVAPRAHLPALRNMAGPDGRLPRWTDRYDEVEVAALFRDPSTRRAVVAEQPRLPLAYYTQRIPAVPGWDDHRCGYLLFGPPYDEVAADAAGRGWPVLTVPGRHLHQLVDPAAVATAVLTLTGGTGTAGR